MSRLNRLPVALAAAVLLAGAATQAFALTPKVASGSTSGLNWTAQSLLTGAAPGGTGTGFDDLLGSFLYHPSFPGYSGVVGMLMDYGPGGAFICSGTLLPDRMSVLTAAHCVSDGAGTANPLTTTILFQPPGGMAPDQRIYTFPNPATQVTVSQYFVNPNYTGEVIDQNDIAVLRLSEMAPEWASSYGIYTGGDLTGKDFNVAGYGRIGTGDAGSVGFTGRLRQGDNMYDYAWGNAAFDGFFTDGFFGSADVEFSFVSDFDNGLAANDQAGLIAQAFGSNAFNDLGVGAREVGVAGGDSGGPNFIDGMIAAVNSYGLTFGTDFGDLGGGLNNGFGEFSGYVPTYIHADWIAAQMVPEPGTYGLMALGLLAVGGIARRRRAV
ncbi:trypsin-like serine protease [Rubrivivax albus]|uniref:Trypsin-like serine protease n=1 Tax=Rubrivivax albus TaxID=2499835 RepID=A0A437JSS6_9BURK|nr:trypsin-like serine protease [Rubrivivax albus]MCB1994911.1 trypsin-like serine protease [Rhodoferax sp.]RVT49980.1 trypsin-like serine protease [Rubrivivax albus]